MTNDQLFKIKQLMEGGILDTALLEIKNDIALDIIHTSYEDNTQREGLYMLSQALNALTMKLQGYVNIYERMQEKD